MLGKVIGSYRVLRFLGEGGMGVVYEAVHQQLGRRAAIKVLHDEYAHEPEMVQRFVNEARALSIVGHPGLVSIYEVGQLESGAPYICMEFLDGETLLSRLERVGNLGSAAFRIGRQVASALAAVHAKGIIHRDLKPDNIMLVADSEVAGGERAKVLDFGLAKLLVSHQGVKTRTGSFFGTPTYMSPEQCGRKAPVGEKSDVYALGATLFEMLAGRPPFLGDEPNQLLGQHLFSMAPALDEQVSGVPPAVASLVRRMLAKSPTERPTMSEVAAELDSFSISVQLPAGGLLLPSSKASRPSDAFQPTINAGMDGLAAEFAAAQAKQQPASPLSAPLPKVRKRRRLLPSLLTLSRATGQFRSAHPVSISAVLGALALAALVVVSTRLYRQQSRASTVPVVQTADALRKVQWSLDSNPAGAQVFRLVDGQVLGQTPWLSVQDAAPGEVAVLLRLSGFKDVVLTLDRSASVARLERLVPLPAPVVSPSVDAVPVLPPKPAKRSHRKQTDVDLQPVR